MEGLGVDGKVRSQVITFVALFGFGLDNICWVDAKKTSKNEKADGDRVVRSVAWKWAHFRRKMGIQQARTGTESNLPPRNWTMIDHPSGHAIFHGFASGM